MCCVGTSRHQLHLTFWFTDTAAKEKTVINDAFEQAVKLTCWGGVCNLFQTSTCCPPSASPRACWTCCVSRWVTATAAFKPCSPSSTPSSSLSAPRRWRGCTAGQDGHAAMATPSTLPSFQHAALCFFFEYSHMNRSELNWFLSSPAAGCRTTVSFVAYCCSSHCLRTFDLQG